MWFSKRSINGFRESMESMYRAGYADSNDGVLWQRNDDAAGLHPSGIGWDSNAIAYPYVRKIKDDFLMLYNGNGFGKSGFGYMLGKCNAFT
jgi:hypothetical protein